MKHCMLMSVLSLLFSLLLPVTVQHAAGLSGDEALPEVSPAASAAPESTADAFSGFDALTGVTLLRGGEVETLSLAEYLPGVVAGEMPASFEPDALRAQAAAACLRRLRPLEEDARREAEKGGGLVMRLGLLLGLMAGIALW